LAANNITAADLKNEQNATAADLLAKGFAPADLFAAGYTLESLADAGVEASVLAALKDTGSNSSGGGAVAAVVVLLLLLGAGVCGYVMHRNRDTQQQQKDQANQANQAIAALGGDGMVEMVDNPLSTLRRKKVLTDPANSTSNVQNKVRTLGRQRCVVVNNVFSIPFDDAGDAANDDDVVVAAAAAASGYLLVAGDYREESGVGAEEVGLAPDYQNVDSTTWEGAVLQGPRDYENAPRTSVAVGKGSVAPTALDAGGAGGGGGGGAGAGADGKGGTLQRPLPRTPAEYLAAPHRADRSNGAEGGAMMYSEPSEMQQVYTEGTNAGATGAAMYAEPLDPNMVAASQPTIVQVYGDVVYDDAETQGAGARMYSAPNETQQQLYGGEGSDVTGSPKHTAGAGAGAR
jgi:hypothetical protein